MANNRTDGFANKLNNLKAHSEFLEELNDIDRRNGNQVAIDERSKSIDQYNGLINRGSKLLNAVDREGN